MDLAFLITSIYHHNICMTLIQSPAADLPTMELSAISRRHFPLSVHDFKVISGALAGWLS